MQEQSSKHYSYSTRSIVVRTWFNHRWFNKEAEACDCKIYRRECRRNRKRWGDIKWRSTMYTNPQCRWNSQATFSGNQWYTCTCTKTMYDVCAHNNLPTSAILVLGLQEEEERWWTTLLRISGASQACFGSLKGCYQRGYYFRERLYSQSVHVWDSKEKLAFQSRLPLRCHIA